MTAQLSRGFSPISSFFLIRKAGCFSKEKTLLTEWRLLVAGIKEKVMMTLSCILAIYRLSVNIVYYVSGSSNCCQYHKVLRKLY